MKILVLNAGSSSLKYQLFNMETAEVLAKGLCERIGSGGAITHKRPNADSFFEETDLPEHSSALKKVIALLCSDEYGVCNTVILRELLNRGVAFSYETEGDVGEALRQFQYLVRALGLDHSSHVKRGLYLGTYLVSFRELVRRDEIRDKLEGGFCDAAQKIVRLRI